MTIQNDLKAAGVITNEMNDVIDRMRKVEGECQVRIMARIDAAVRIERKRMSVSRDTLIGRTALLAARDLKKESI